jgi:hypothetical protein
MYTHRFSPLKSSLEASQSYTVSLFLIIDHMMASHCLFSAVILVFLNEKCLLVLDIHVPSMTMSTVLDAQRRRV